MQSVVYVQGGLNPAPVSMAMCFHCEDGQKLEEYCFTVTLCQYIEQVWLEHGQIRKGEACKELQRLIQTLDCWSFCGADPGPEN